MEEVWKLESGDDHVTVALLDSGVSTKHSDFDHARIRYGFDYVDGDFLPEDENGHGTSVAGIVGASRENHLGIAGLADVSILAIRILDAQNRGRCVHLALAVIEAVEASARVINISAQCDRPDPAVAVAIDYAISRGVIVAAAAGNNGATGLGECPAFPASLPDVVAVGATDMLDRRAAFSCPGADLLAPGVSIHSTALEGYGVFSGTSMAAPHVSAAAALILSACGGIKERDVRSILLHTGESIEGSLVKLLNPRGALESVAPCASGADGPVVELAGPRTPWASRGNGCAPGEGGC